MGSLSLFAAKSDFSDFLQGTVFEIQDIFIGVIILFNTVNLCDMGYSGYGRNLISGDILDFINHRAGNPDCKPAVVFYEFFLKTVFSCGHDNCIEFVCIFTFCNICENLILKRREAMQFFFPQT